MRNIENNKTFGIMVHGGAGSERIKESSERAAKIANALKESASVGYDLIIKDGRSSDSSNSSAVDAVEAAVASMEDSGLFNAGLGSCLTLDKRIEMDASIMDGRDLSAGSVGMVQNVQNPIKLARLVMDRTDHVMLVGDSAAELARLLGIKVRRLSATVVVSPATAAKTTTTTTPTPTTAKTPDMLLQKLRTYDRIRRQMKTRWRKNYKLLPLLLSSSSTSTSTSSSLLSPSSSSQHFGTVGAVACDRDGNVAAAVSTGGRWLKMHGRIGDSAIVGAGLYADNHAGAACATGSGELIMRLCLSKYACDYMKKEEETGGGDKKEREGGKEFSTNALQSATMAIRALTKRFGPSTGGIITVDRMGNFGASANTKSMPVALQTSNDKNHKNQRVRIALNADNHGRLLLS